MKLEKMRNKIDVLDGKILSLLQKRFKLAREIGKFKKTCGLAIVDKNREKEILKNLITRGNKLKLSKSFVTRLFNLIMEESKSIQRT